MSVKMFENNGKNVSGNVVKVKSQQNIKSLYMCRGNRFLTTL